MIWRKIFPDYMIMASKKPYFLGGVPWKKRLYLLIFSMKLEVTKISQNLRPAIDFTEHFFIKFFSN